MARRCCPLAAARRPAMALSPAQAACIIQRRAIKDFQLLSLLGNLISSHPYTAHRLFRRTPLIVPRRSHPAPQRDPLRLPQSLLICERAFVREPTVGANEALSLIILARRCHGVPPLAPLRAPGWWAPRAPRLLTAPPEPVGRGRPQGRNASWIPNSGPRPSHRDLCISSGNFSLT